MIKTSFDSLNKIIKKTEPDLIHTPYESLDTNGKTIYTHYQDCIRVLQRLTTSLIEEIHTNVTYLEPLLLDLSLSKETYIKYRYILNSLEKQMTSFENKFYYEKNDTLSILDIQRTLVISNQIRSLNKKLLGLIEDKLPMNLTQDIEAISTSMVNLCNRIKYYTKQCLLDIRLYKNSAGAIQTILNNKNIFGKGRKDLEAREKTKTQCRYQDKIPLNIRVDVELFYDYIKEMNWGNPRETFSRTSIEELETNLFGFVELYKSIKKDIEKYIKDLCRLELPIFLKIYETLNKELLDCTITKKQYIKYLKLSSSLEKINGNVENYDIKNIINNLEELIKIISEIILVNPELKLLKTDFTVTINYELDMIIKMVIALGDLKNDCIEYIRDVEFFANMDKDSDELYEYSGKKALIEDNNPEEVVEEDPYNDEWDALYDYITFRKREKKRYYDYTDYLTAKKDEKTNKHIKTLKYLLISEEQEDE